MRFKGNRWFLLFLAVVLVGLFGCSSSESDSPSKKVGDREVSEAVQTQNNGGPGFNSCTLLTEADIHEFFPNASIKITKQGDVPNDALGSRVCFYELSGDDMVFVQTILYRTSDMAKELQDNGRSAEGNYLMNKKYVDKPVPVKGIGKDAYFGGTGLKAFGGLNVLINSDTALNVTVGLGRGNDDAKTHLKIEKGLAKKIMSRL